MIAARAGDVENLRCAARLPGRAAERLDKAFLADQARAGAGEQQAAGRDDLHGESVHVEITLERVVDLLAVAGLLRRVKNYHVKALASRDDVAQPGENVGLDVTNANLVQARVLSGQRQGRFVEIDSSHFRGSSLRLGVHRE